MQIQTLLIDERSRNRFDNLAPREFFSPFDLPGRFRIGAVKEDENGLHAAGVLVFDLLERQDEVGIEAVLQWLYVAKDSRRLGAADSMMSQLLESLADAGVERLVCDLPMEDDYDFLCAYLEAWEMKFTLLDRYECAIPLEELLKNPFFQNRPGRQVIPLSNCFQSSLLRKIEQFQELPDVPSSLNAYLPECDSQVSCAYIENGDIKGLTLLRALDATNLELLLFRPLGKSAKYMQDMLLFAALQAKEKYPPKTLIHMDCHTESAASLIAYFFPDLQPRLVRRGTFELFEEEE